MGLVVVEDREGDQVPAVGAEGQFSLGGVAHLVPERITAALSAIVDLTYRGALREPAPAVVPLAEVAGVHRALENRAAPHKTVLSVGRQ